MTGRKVQASLMKRVLCHGKAVAASMLRQEAACLPVRFPLVPGWPLSRSLSSPTVLPMQHHGSQVSSLGASMTCQQRRPFAAQVSPATLALSVYRMQCNPGCNCGGTAFASAALRRAFKRIRAPCDASNVNRRRLCCTHGMSCPRCFPAPSSLPIFGHIQHLRG